MKILIVQDTDWIRRFPIQHTHLAERLVQRGHKIRVIDYEILWKTEGNKELLSTRKEIRVSRIIPHSDILVIRPSIVKISVLDYFSMIFTYSKEINNQIIDFNPDLIMGNDILTTFLAFRAAKKHNIPTLFYSIDIDHRLIPYRFLQPIGKIIESWNMRSADKVLSINEGLREYTIKMGSSRKKTDVIRAGIDLEKFKLNISGSEIRDKYHINKDDIVLFFMGWLYHFSGLKEVAIELAKNKSHLPNLKMLVVGDGDAYEDLIQIQKEYHLENNLILAGKQPYDLLQKFIAAANICLLPAYNNEIMRDIVPIKMYEYLAMGKPVISTKLYGVIKEFMEENGVIYANDSKEVFYKALELIDSGKIDDIGKKGSEFVKEIDWSIITDEYEQFLNKMVTKSFN